MRAHDEVYFAFGGSALRIQWRRRGVGGLAADADGGAADIPALRINLLERADNVDGLNGSSARIGGAAGAGL